MGKGRLETRRREEQEFQLRLFSMMYQGQGVQRGATPYIPKFSCYSHHEEDT